MPVIQHLVQRWGFVKLTRYGLVLTPEGRIVSTRSEVLDDGSGGRIVGWQDGDPVVVELAAPRSARLAPVARPAVPTSTEKTSVVAVGSTVEPPGMAETVAPDAVVDEDDWEWMIALARARDAETTEVARPDPVPVPQREAPEAATPRPFASRVRTRPMAAIPMRDPAASAEWPSTAPIGAIDYDDYSRVPTRPAVPIPTHAVAAVSLAVHTVTPSTVIPVPALPTMRSTAASRFEPVVRTGPRPGITTPPAAAPRFSKGTGASQPLAAPAMMSDDTESSLSIGDRTKPGIALPPAARAVQLPSVKRRAALSR